MSMSTLSLQATLKKQLYVYMLKRLYFISIGVMYVAQLKSFKTEKGTQKGKYKNREIENEMFKQSNRKIGKQRNTKIQRIQKSKNAKQKYKLFFYFEFLHFSIFVFFVFHYSSISLFLIFPSEFHSQVAAQ